MKNTDFMNLSLPEGADKIDVEILNNDFKKLENEASKHYIKQQIEVDGTATIICSIGPYVQLENLTDNILNVSIGDELIVLMKGDNRKIRTISGENYGVVTNGAVRITYYINAQTYADENFYKKEKVDELLQNVEATVEVDAELSETSENPVQNKVITAELASYATTAEVESKVTEKVAEIVAGAPEDFDTLKEMSDWLTEHEDSAATMNSAIQKNAEDIATANENIEKKLDKKAICIEGADYNSFVITGFYEALGRAEKPTQNAPNGIDTNNNFYVIVQHRDNNYTSQIATSARNDAGVYVRTMSHNTWNAWRKLLDNTTEYAKSEDLETANTNIQKNVDDITATKNDVAINRTTLGTQCKNLLNFTGNTTTIQGVTFTVNEDRSITVSGKNTGSTGVWYWVEGTRNVPMDIFEVGRSYIVSGTPADNLDITGTKLAQIRVEKNTAVVVTNKAGEDTKFTISTSNRPEYITIFVSAGADFTDKPITFYPMIRDADITDNTYEPYKPSLQEQINSLIRRIETLEGATTTTEGGG